MTCDGCLAHTNTDKHAFERSAMAADTSSNVSKQDFHHPYQPYNIQTQFMTALYDCIEQGKVGIFESPTGMTNTTSLLR